MTENIKIELERIKQLTGKEITLEDIRSNLELHSDYEILLLLTGVRLGLELN